MDNAVDLIFGKDAVKRRSVADIRLIEFDLLACKFFNPFQALFARIAEIVDDHGVITRL